MANFVLMKELESSIKHIKKVPTYIDLATVTELAEGLKILVLVDETHENKKSLYEYKNSAWVFSVFVADIDDKLVFTEHHNMYITDKDKNLIKIGDILPYKDFTELTEKNPGIPNKLYMTENGKLYYYSKSANQYKLASGGGVGGGTRKLGEVETKALIATTYTKPDDFDSVVVLADESVDGQPTWYMWNGVAWTYQGIYFVETLVVSVSDRNTRSADILAATEYTLPFKILVNKKHLEIYLEDELLIPGVDYIEVGTDGYVNDKVRFTNSIPNEARLLFKRLISNQIGDSSISRMSKDSWLKYAQDAWVEFNALVMSTGFDNISKSININASSGATTKTVPPACGIGTRLLYRKTDNTVNKVTINMPEGETVTRANLKSLSLSSQFDFWEFEKISDTQWNLTAGYERGSNSNGEYTRRADGTQSCNAWLNINLDIATGAFAIYTWTYPLEFNTVLSACSSGNPTISSDFYGCVQHTGLGLNKCSFRFRNGSTSAQAVGDATFHAEGRWY